MKHRSHTTIRNSFRERWDRTIAERSSSAKRGAKLLHSFTAGIALLTGVNVNAGTNFWDLNNAADTNDFIIRGSADGGSWRQEPGGNGFVQVTGAVDGQSGTILFPDFDNGLVVKAFTFECLVKLGDGEDPPADGFSLNYASVADPVVVNILGGGAGAGFAGSEDNGGNELSLPEEGTTTGLAIGFDTWGAPGGGNGAVDPSTTLNRDLRGISIRVNGTQRAQIPMPNLLVNTPGGNPNDPTSLETGFPDAGTGNTGTNLIWQPLRVTLDEQGVINVFWKGTLVLTNYQSDFFPIPGRIVFAGRTGGNNAIQWVDDISISTIPSTTFLITGMTGGAGGFRIQVNDAAGSELVPATISLQLNGELLAPSTYQVTKAGNVSTITYSTLPTFFPPGVTNLVSITAEDNNGVEASLERSFVVRPYVQLDPAWKAAAGDYTTTTPGFKGFIHQIAVGRGPGDANNSWNALRHLAGGYIDPSTGNPYPNLVDTAGGSGAAAGGLVEFPDTSVFSDPWINVNQDVNAATPAEAGAFRSPNFPDYFLPGIPGTGPAASNTDNIAAEWYSFLELTGPKLYTFVFNSDDGFRVSFGPDLRSALFTAPGGSSTASNAAQFNGGKGSSDVEFDVVVPEGAGGVYLARVAWWEGGGGANAEFFTRLDAGGNALVGDTANGGVPAYKSTAATPPMPADVVSAAPWPGQTDVAPDSQVQIIIADGAGAVVDANSVTVTLNGTSPPKTATKTGDKALVTVTPAGLLDPGAVYQVEIAYTAGGQPKTASYSFTVINYPTLPPALGTAVGTGTGPGMRWRTYQTAAGHGTTITGAENVLAGGNGADISDPNGWVTPRDGQGFFTITDWINFDQTTPTPAAQGNFSATSTVPGQNVPEEGLPGIPGTTLGTDNIAAECLTYLELEAGFHRMVVNSDDGFLVTTGVNGSLAEQKFLSLGQFDGGRGASDTLFFFNVEQAGVYFFRLLWFEGGGGANVEWFTVNADGTRALVNGEQTGAIPAFQTRSVPEPEIPSEAAFETPTIADGQVTITWTGTGTLEESANLVDWTAVTPAPTGNTLTVTPEGAVKAYRILVSP